MGRSSFIVQRSSFSPVAVLSLAFAIWGCHDPGPLGPGSGPQVIALGNLSGAPSGDARQIVEAGMVGEALLRLRVSYGGGCREPHPFTLYVALSGRANLLEAHLHHDDLDDPCKAYQERYVGFSLQGLKERFGMSGTVILELDENPAIRVHF